ncbi:MAG: VanW family protein [Myxococcales bacterium]|nr:VanW family protein [Myxococcales bacterium]
MHFPPPPSSAHPRTAQTPSRPSVHGRHAPPPPRPHRWGLRIGVAAGLFAFLGGSALGLKLHYLPTGAVLPGLTIDGERLPEEATAASVQALAADRAKSLLGRRIAFNLEGHDRPVLEATLEELGVRVDVERTAAVALRVGEDGDLITRAEAVREAREGRTDVPLFTYVDRDVAMAKLLALKEIEDTQPVSARLDLEKHETVPERDGRYIDADETIAALELAARERRTESIALPLKTFAPRISSAFLKSLDISTVIAEYETHFSRGGEARRRGKNIDTAAQKLDGIVISPGEMLSFNDIVGERSEENGFHKSWEIFKGEMVEGIGGGTCQVSSTFHAATLFAGFDVLERLPHSRPSAYIPMGLDSTVVYPAVDLKVRNPHPFPVVVHAKSSGNTLRVELLGKMRPVHVGFNREVVSTLPYKRKVEEDPTLSGKKVVVKQHGIQGYKIKRTRLFTYPDGTKKKEEETDTYPPTTEIYKVPVGFDVAALPSLPGGEGEDSELGGNPSPTPPSARGPSAAGTDATAATQTPADDVEFVDAPGAHAPSASQRDPAKMLWLRR